MFTKSRKVSAALLLVALAASLSTSAIAGPALSWNLSRDIMLHTTATNPDGVWTYMSAPMGSLLQQGTYTALSQFQLPCAGILQSRCWTTPAANGPLVFVSDIDQPTYVFNADAGVPVVAGNSTDAVVVRWTSPFSGNIKISGRFSDITSNMWCGDGVNWHIAKGNNTLASGALNFTTTPDGKVFSLSTNVNSGTNINFIVDAGPNGDSTCDATELDLLITQQQ